MSKPKQKTVVPSLRFPEFRDAGPWRVMRLGDVYRFKPTNSWSRDQLNYESGTVKNIHYGDIHKGLSSRFGIGEEVVPYVNDELISSISEETFCEEGDIVFADASEDVDDIGKAIEILDTSGQQLVSGLHTILASQIDSKIVVGFGAYLFASSGVRKQIQQRAQGAKVLGISKAQLAEVKLAYPAEPIEQQKIADCLSSLDDLIRAEEAQLTALKDHKKGLMQRLFPAEGETTPRLRFPEFRDAGPWEVKRLEEVATGFLDGDWIEAKDQSPTGIRLIQTGNIGIGRFLENTERSRFISEDTFQRLRCTEVFPGDLLISRLPDPAGRCCLIPDIGTRMITAVDCTIVRFDNRNISPYFYLSYCQTDKYFHEVATRCSGSTRQRISKQELAQVLVPFPSFSEQQKIADCLSSLDDLIRARAARIEDLKTHKRGLMQQLFPREVA